MPPMPFVAPAPVPAAAAAPIAGPGRDMPVKHFLKSQWHAPEPENLCSLAVVPAPEGHGMPMDVWKSYLRSPSNYSACHDVAAMLMSVCSTGATPTESQNAAGIAAAVVALGGNNVIWLKSAHQVDDGHSVVLFSYNGWVESLEAWAGRAGRAVYTLHECLLHDEHPIWLSAANAITALNLIRAGADADIRRAAWYQLSRGAGPGGIFGTENPALPLTVRIAPLQSFGGMAAAYRHRINEAKAWVFRVKAGRQVRSVCRHCTKRKQSGLAWYTCDECSVGYCVACVTAERWDGEPCPYGDRCRGTIRPVGRKDKDD